jgi:hypothetical protein
LPSNDQRLSSDYDHRIQKKKKERRLQFCSGELWPIKTLFSAAVLVYPKSAKVGQMTLKEEFASRNFSNVATFSFSSTLHLDFHHP